MTSSLLRAWIVLMFGLTACSGGGSGGSDDGSSGASGGFSVTYTHLANLDSWEWAVDWFVEETGTVSGPFDSGGNGVVNLGEPSAASVHLTRREAFFYFTFVDVPVAAISYYTGDRDLSSPNRNVTVDVANTTIGDELMLFYPFPNWWDVDQSPYSLTQTVAAADLFADDGTASVFISYRSSDAEEPMSRYGFALDLEPTALSSVAFDVGALNQRAVTREWQSSEMLTGSDLPYLWARRNGLFLITGESTTGGLTNGFIGMPDQFPADSWYLVSGPTLLPEIVKAIDPGSTDIIEMEPVPGFIDDATIVYDTNAETFSVTAPGVAPIHLAHLRLASASGAWDVYFPATALQISGDVVTLPLPKHPAHAELPAYDFATIAFYRLDDGATAETMYRYLWNRRAHSLPSFAMESESVFF